MTGSPYPYDLKSLTHIFVGCREGCLFCFWKCRRLSSGVCRTCCLICVIRVYTKLAFLCDDDDVCAGVYG